MYTTGYNVYIKGPGGKILFRQNAAGFVGFEFADFNGDGYKDLQISYISNTPGIADLLLYDKRSKNLRLVKAFDNYPDAIRIKHTNMYYSYHHSGCADADWDSDLFKIENFKTVRIGNINCQDCSNNPKENRISVYTVNNKDRKLLKTFKSDIVNDYTDTKWGFIAWYWKRNHKHFTK